MAQGWLRHFAQAAQYPCEVLSAGTAPKGVHPLAIRVMAQAGVDISDHRSKHLDEYADQDFDAVVTVCGRAHDACPVWTGSSGVGGEASETIHQPFEDPDKPGLSEQELLPIFYKVRDEIRDWAERFIAQQCGATVPGAGAAR